MYISRFRVLRLRAYDLGLGVRVLDFGLMV